MDPASTRDGRPAYRHLALVVLPIVVLAYLPTFLGGWVWDDHYHNEDNPQLDRPSSVLTSTIYEGQALGHGDNYRPVTMLSHVLAHNVLPGPRTERTISLLLHLLATCLVAGIAIRLGASAHVAWFAALLLGVHTGASEGAIWTNARSDLFASVFVLAAWWSWLRERTLAAGLFLAIAVWCKESCLVVPGVMLLLMWGHRRWSWRLVVPTMTSIAVYLGTRQLLGIQMEFGAAGHEPVAAIGAVTIRALHLLAVPSSADALPAYNPSSILGLAALVGGGVAAWFGRGRPALAGICATCLLLVPNASASAHNEVLGDRYFHLTVAASAVGVAALIGTRRLPRIAWLVPLVLAALTFVRAYDWVDDRSLFTSSLERNPDNPLAAYHLAFDLHTRDGDCDGALPLYQQAADVEPRAANGTQSCLLNLGRFDEAASMGPDLAAASPGNSTPASNTARAELMRGELDAAEEWAREAIRRQPHRTRNWTLLGQVLGTQGRYVEAIEAFGEALARTPGDPEATGGLELAQRKADEARDRSPGSQNSPPPEGA